MKAFWKIPKEWVHEWGLSGNEALLLADIIDWPNCTSEERARRIGVSKRGVLKMMERLKHGEQSAPIIGEQSAPSLVNKVHRKKCSHGEQSALKTVNKVHQNGEQSALPPYNPLYIEEQEEQEKNITLDKSNVPNADASADKKTSPKKKKKYTDEEIKLHGELKSIFCEEWLKTHGEEFYWGPAAMSATIKIADQIKFYMPSEQKNDTEQLKFNFRFFVQKIFTSQDNWLRTNATPQVIASKFNEIYTSLKNGKPRQQQQQNGPTDDFLRRVAAEVEANGGLAF